MVSIVVLEPGQRPPDGARYLVIERRETDGVAIEHRPSGLRRPSLHYRVGRQKWAFWLREGPRLAERLGLDAVYFITP